MNTNLVEYCIFNRKNVYSKYPIIVSLILYKPYIETELNYNLLFDQFDITQKKIEGETLLQFKCKLKNLSNIILKGIYIEEYAIIKDSKNNEIYEKQNINIWELSEIKVRQLLYKYYPSQMDKFLLENA